MDIDAMKVKAAEASKLMGALANEKRLLILCQLVNGECSVTELADTLQTRQSTVSQHLALLRNDGLVQTRHDAQIHYYSLAGEEARTLLKSLDQLYCAPGRSKQERATLR